MSCASCGHDGRFAIERVGDDIIVHCMGCGRIDEIDDSAEARARAQEREEAAVAASICTWIAVAGVMLAALACFSGAYSPSIVICFLTASMALIALGFRRVADEQPPERQQ
jgi:hypothetical protein